MIVFKLQLLVGVQQPQPDSQVPGELETMLEGLLDEWFTNCVSGDSAEEEEGSLAASDRSGGEKNEFDSVFDVVEQPSAPPRVPVPPEIARLAGKWGIMTIAVKRATVTEPCGSLEARCCLHRRSAVSGCKKTFVIRENTEAARRETLLTAKFWLSQGSKVPRQWMHVFQTPLAPLPPESAIESAVVNSMPHNWVVVPDDEYYNTAPSGPHKRRKATQLQTPQNQKKQRQVASHSAVQARCM